MYKDVVQIYKGYCSAIKANETELCAVTWTDLESVIHSGVSPKELWSHLRESAGLKKITKQ